MHLAEEGARLMRICNSCRYCEGYCAVFPAIELRREFTAGDLDYLANLCHNCGECLRACQYAPPHEFGVNVPELFSKLRTVSYRKHAPLWSRGFDALALIAAFAVAIVWNLLAPRGATFYAVVSHGAMVWIFGASSLVAGAIMTVCVLNFARGQNERLRSFLDPRAFGQAIKDAATLRYLGDPDCSQARRWLHQITVFGFGLCFASTCVAAFYHYGLGLTAPYAYTSAPVVLGTSGGILLTTGAAGLFLLRLRVAPALQWQGERLMSCLFLAMLLLTSISGLALLAFRGTSRMPGLLTGHLAIVLVLFLSAPYTKAVHGLYRLAALVKYTREKQRGIRRP